MSVMLERRTGKMECRACGARMVVAIGICARCGASMSGPLAPRAAPAPGRGAERLSWIPAGIAAALAVVAGIVFLATLPGCASAPPEPPPPPRPVPSIVGQQRLEAEQALERAGLRPRYSYRYAELDMDLVVEQSPEAGTPLAPPTPVEVVIATRRPR